MNLRNDYSTSGKKMFKRKANYSKLSFKKGIKVIGDDPAFHLNRTLKQYINNKLSKNISGENNNTNLDSKIINNLSSFVPKFKDNNNCLSRSNTVADIIKKRKLFSFKKNSKLKKINYSSKSKSSSGKKMIKSLSSNKYNLNLSHYKVIINRKNINLNLNKINKNQILKKNSNNSTQKYIRYSGSTALSNNDTNQLLEKNSAIFPYNNYSNNYNNNNILLSNNSTLEINNLKTPMRKTTDKKNKYTMQYFTQNNYYNYTNIKNKDKKYNNNICLLKNSKNMNNKNGQNNMTLEGKVNLKSISSYNQPINNSNIKNESNNINNPSDIYKDDNNKNNNNEYSYTISNMKNTPQKCNNNIFDMNIINNMNNMNKSINICSTNKIEDKINKEYLKTDNSFEYIKRIEFLENENKFLKGEIYESKNKLLLLENKINKLLVEKNSIEKEECPRPTPYVKKYSMETLQNFQPSSSIDININSSEIQKKENERKIKNNLNEEIINEINDKNMINKSLVNKEQIYIYQPSNNINEKQKMNNLGKNKSNLYMKNDINTKNKINVNKNYKKITNNTNDKKKMWKKVNNMKQLVDKYRFTHLNFYTEGNINNI